MLHRRDSPNRSNDPQAVANSVLCLVQKRLRPIGELSSSSRRCAQEQKPDLKTECQGAPDASLVSEEYPSKGMRVRFFHQTDTSNARNCSRFVFVCSGQKRACSGSMLEVGHSHTLKHSNGKFHSILGL